MLNFVFKLQWILSFVVVFIVSSFHFTAIHYLASGANIFMDWSCSWFLHRYRNHCHQTFAQLLNDRQPYWKENIKYFTNENKNRRKSETSFWLHHFGQHEGFWDFWFYQFKNGRIICRRSTIDLNISKRKDDSIKWIFVTIACPFVNKTQVNLVRGSIVEQIHLQVIQIISFPLHLMCISFEQLL